MKTIKRILLNIISFWAMSPSGIARDEAENQCVSVTEVTVRNYKHAEKFTGRRGILTSVAPDESGGNSHYIGMAGSFVTQCGAVKFKPDTRLVCLTLWFPYKVKIFKK